MEPTRAELKAWIEKIIAETGETASGLARKAGLATTTLTRFLAEDDGPMLGMRSIAKIAHATRRQPLGLAPAAAPAAGGLAEAEAEPYVASGGPVASAVAALVSGRNAADPWLLKSHALELAGYMPGDILIVDLAQVAQSGNVVCAVDYKFGNVKPETVFRIYEWPYLVAASSAPRLRKPLLVDNERVVIKGVIVASLRVAI